MADWLLEFCQLGFFYPSSRDPVFEGLSLRVGPGWTGVIGPNGSGKTTLLRLACGQLAPTQGTVVAPEGVIYCAQRTDEPPDELDQFIEATDALACSLRGRLGVQSEWNSRWTTLSHGERKRVQIAMALWRQPRLLAIDEPTNHIDADARHLLMQAMRSYRGIGLLVSHDRELLDALCSQCLIVEPPTVRARPGGYTKAMELAKAEQQSLRHERAVAKENLARIERETAARRHEAAAADKKRSKARVNPKDRDAKGRIDLAIYTGKDGKAGRLQRQLEGRVRQAQQRVASIYVKKQPRMSMEFRGQQSQRNTLLRLAAGWLDLGNGRRLAFPDLVISPQDRVALVGPNGAGKSTLVRHLVGALDLPDDKVVYLAQEIDCTQASDIMTEVRHLSYDQLGQVMAVVGCLGSEPQRVLETDQPSPGEIRKIMLAMGLSRTPHLIIMDEPTNHLDLPSIEAMENALADCPCAMLLVSHDQRFLQRLTRVCWMIVPESGDAEMHLRVDRIGPGRGDDASV